MNEYHFELAGLHTVLRTQEELRVSDRLRPFLFSGKAETDCTITVQASPRLPEISPNAIWSGPECYDRQGDVLLIFHSDEVKTTPFAVTELTYDGNVTVSVLKGYEDRFSGTSGVLNRIGLDCLLLQHRAMLLHGAFIKYRDQGIVFTGPSGIGKSTQASLWEKHLGAEILNGDRVILRKDGFWQAYGAPYAGSSGIYRKENAPLVAVVALKQGKENKLEKLSGREALRELYPQLAVCRWDKESMEKAMDLLLSLLGDVPVYRFSCLRSESAVTCLQKGLGL